MDALSDASCNAIFTYINPRNLWKLYWTQEESPLSQNWQNAIAVAYETELEVQITIGCTKKGRWEYTLDYSPHCYWHQMKFRDLKALKQPPKVTAVCFGTFKTSLQRCSSLAQVQKILKLTRPFLSSPRLALVDSDKMPQKELSALLSLYDDSVFVRSVSVEGAISREMEDYVAARLSSPSLSAQCTLAFKNVDLSRNLQLQIKKFALKNPFGNLGIRPQCQNFAFFKELFEKPEHLMGGERHFFMADFALNCGFVGIQERSPAGPFSALYQLKREDGVRVAAHWIRGEWSEERSFAIQFKCPQEEN